MNKRRGIIIDARGFLTVSSGEGAVHELSIGDTLAQNELILLSLQKGEVKEHPLLGVGISDMINDNDVAEWRWRIAEDLALDGLKVKKLVIDNGKIDIEANYEG